MKKKFLKKYLDKIYTDVQELITEIKKREIC